MSTPYHSECPGCAGKMPRHLALCRECWWIVPPPMVDAVSWIGWNVASAARDAVLRLLTIRRQNNFAIT